MDDVVYCGRFHARKAIEDKDDPSGKRYLHSIEKCARCDGVYDCRPLKNVLEGIDGLDDEHAEKLLSGLEARRKIYMSGHSKENTIGEKMISTLQERVHPAGLSRFFIDLYRRALWYVSKSTGP